MKRRDFVGLIGGVAAWPVLAWAQQLKKPTVGVLWHGSAEREHANPFYHYLHDYLAGAGYVTDKTVKYEERYATEKQELYDELAKELVALNPDVLVAPTLAAALALKKATSQIPIAFLGVPDPVGLGLVESMAKPGGNVTGLATAGREIYIKRIAILKELVPTLSRFALLADMDVPSQVAVETDHYTAAAAANGVQLESFSARDKRTIDEAFRRIVGSHCDAVVIVNQGVFYLFRDELAAAGLSNKLPTMAPSTSFVSNGLLVAYSAAISDYYREFVTSYPARILRGEKPRDLPVQFPAKFEFVLNLKTASALNLTVSPLVLTAADRVIE